MTQTITTEEQLQPQVKPETPFAGKVSPRLERLALLVGEEGVQALEQATVCVLGLGGVGGNCALALARSGVGHLVLCDGDVVNQSDFNRQAISHASLLGLPKPEAAARIIAEINPDIEVDTVCRRFLPEDIGELLAGGVDYVIDCIDDLPVKLGLAGWCDTHGVKLISSMGTARKWHPEMLEFADITKTSVCPVCKVMRRELKRLGVAHLQVLYSREPPAPMLSDTPRPLGSTAFVPPVAGTMLAGFVVQYLLGME